MKLKSRGLGRKELVMDFREYEITREGDEVVVSGTIREPVNWDFSIRIAQSDIPGMLRIGVNRHTLRLGARWLFRRKPREAEAEKATAGRSAAATSAAATSAVETSGGSAASGVTRAKARRRRGAQAPDAGLGTPEAAAGTGGTA